MGQRDILLLIARLFAKYGIAYLLTGSFAVSYYGYPRATHDIDFILEIPLKHKNKLLKSLKELDESFLCDFLAVKEAIEKASQFNILHLESGIKLDFWIIGHNEFEQNKFKRKKEIKLSGQKINIVSAEDLILTKLAWCKEVKSERHMRDCVGMWKLSKRKLDRKYLMKWIGQLELQKLFDEMKRGEY